MNEQFKNRKLYSLTTVKHDLFYIIADDPTEAEEKLLCYFEEKNLYFKSERVVTKIERLGSVQQNYDGRSDKLLLL